MDPHDSDSHHSDSHRDPRPTVTGAHSVVRDRWLAAVGYIGPLCLLPMLSKDKSDFLRHHAQQAFVLFFLEAVTLALLLILDNTIGRIPVLGFVLLILLQLVSFVFFLVVSIVGFVKALAGEDFRLPVVDEYAERVPVAD